MVTCSNKLLDNLQKSLEYYCMQGIRISPYLTAIQSTEGQTPGEKYKNLNQTLKNMVVKTEMTKADYSTLYLDKDIPEALGPFLRIIIGNILRSDEAVIEALKSEDIPVTNQAFKAKWFFHSSNPIISADYFAANVFPYVSRCVRFKIIKALSQSLIGAESKAEEFFDTFSNLYGAQEVMPLLPACSETFIEKTMSVHEISLSYKILVQLYKRHPDLVIRCLKLYLKLRNASKNKLSLVITDKIYENFLPHLIRHHPRVFMELCNTPYSKKIGTTCTKSFLKDNLELFIQKPRPFIDYLPIHIVSKMLPLHQFETMFGNLLPQNISDFNLESMIKYLEYYPKEKREYLVRNAFNLKYYIDLKDASMSIYWHDLFKIHDEISVSLFEELFVRCAEFSKFNSYLLGMIKSSDRRYDLLNRQFKNQYNTDVMKIFDDDFYHEDINKQEKNMVLNLLPANKREDIAIKRIEKCEVKSKEYYKWYVYMRPEKSFPIFIDAIAKSSNDIDRLQFLKQMVESCAINDKKEDMQLFLEYYNNRHKNESVIVLDSVIAAVNGKWDLEKLERSHYSILIEIFQRTHTKDELKSIDSYKFIQIIETMIRYLVADSYQNIENVKINNNYLDKILSVIIDGEVDFKYIAYDRSTEIHGPILKKLEDEMVQRYFYGKMLKLIGSKYKENKTQWLEKAMNKIYKLVSRTLLVIKRFNKSVDKLNKKRIALKDYCLYLEMLKDFLTSNYAAYERCKTFDELQSIDPNVILNLNISRDDFVDDKIIKENIRSSKAIAIFKKNEKHISKFLNNYIEKCKELLKHNTREGGLAAKRFLILSKWYQDIPVKIIENCLKNLTDANNWKILGVMLEGEVFGKLVTPLIPETASMNVEGDDARQYYDLMRSSLAAMNLTCPPVPLHIIVLFFKGDYTKLVVQVLERSYQRLAEYKLINFAELLTNKPVSVKKHGIRFCFQITPRTDQKALVQRLWEQEPDQSIREMIATEVQARLARTPNDSNWNAMEICIDGLTVKDKLALNVICNIASIKSKYINSYIERLVGKIEELAKKHSVEVGEEHKDFVFSAAIATEQVLKSISEEAVPFLSENLVINLVEKYCFIKPSKSNINLLIVAENFAKQVFKRSFSTKYYKFFYTPIQPSI